MLELVNSALFHNDSLCLSASSLSACGSSVNRAIQVSEIEKLHNIHAHTRKTQHKHEGTSRAATNVVHTPSHTHNLPIVVSAPRWSESNSTSHLITNLRNFHLSSAVCLHICGWSLLFSFFFVLSLTPYFLSLSLLWYMIASLFPFGHIKHPNQTKKQSKPQFFYLNKM